MWLSVVQHFVPTMFSPHGQGHQVVQDGSVTTRIAGQKLVPWPWGSKFWGLERILSSLLLFGSRFNIQKKPARNCRIQKKNFKNGFFNFWPKARWQAVCEIRDEHPGQWKTDPCSTGDWKYKLPTFTERSSQWPSTQQPNTKPERPNHAIVFHPSREPFGPELLVALT